MTDWTGDDRTAGFFLIFSLASSHLRQRLCFTKIMVGWLVAMAGLVALLPPPTSAELPCFTEAGCDQFYKNLMLVSK